MTVFQALVERSAFAKVRRFDPPAGLAEVVHAGAGKGKACRESQGGEGKRPPQKYSISGLHWHCEKYMRGLCKGNIQ
jgi:hypothetical protein